MQSVFCPRSWQRMPRELLQRCHVHMAAPVHLAAAKAPMHTPSQEQAASLEAAGSGLLTLLTTSKFDLRVNV